jgi:hypothetical protein
MNLRELFSKYPLGCESFGAEWLRRWEVVGRLLDAPAELQCQAHVSKRWWLMKRGSVAELLTSGTPVNRHLNRHICLLDGTIVKEWGAK